MDWIYLSPHLDDVVLSCGGLVWEQAQGREVVAIWTICAGDPPPESLSSFAASLHERWGSGREAVAQRRVEDVSSCRRLGADSRHFPIPDCIYRRDPIDGAPLYDSEEAIFNELHPVETALVEALKSDLSRVLPPQVNLVCPLALGGHVDHRLVRIVAGDLGVSLWYYADYPYVLKEGGVNRDFHKDLEFVDFPVSETGLVAWIESIAAHASQISTFWLNLDEMQIAIRDYHQQVGGVRLWRGL